MSTEKLDALIIRNLGDLDAATKRLAYGIEGVVWKAIDGIVEHWRDRNRWLGAAGWGDDEPIWLAAPQWRPTGSEPVGDDVLAYFALEVGPGDNEYDETGLDYFMLTRLCRAGNGTAGFRFQKGAALELKRALWKKLAVQHCATGLAQSAGFAYEEKTGSFFMPVQIDSEALAVALEQGDVAEALGPLREALGHLIVAQNSFQGLIDAAAAAMTSTP